MKPKLFAPKEFWETPKDMRGGCGPGEGIGDRLVPDKILGLSVRAACSIHDFMYAVADYTVEAKEEADRVFLNNLIRLILNSGGWLVKPRLMIALCFYKAVKYFGGRAFWKNKNEADTEKED